MSASTMLRAETFGPAERLYEVVRRRYPQIATAVVRDEDTDLPHVRVTYRDAGPKVIFWTGTTYRWRKGNGPWTVLYDDPDRTADAAAAGLGVPTAPEVERP